MQKRKMWASLGVALSLVVLTACTPSQVATMETFIEETEHIQDELTYDQYYAYVIEDAVGVRSGNRALLPEEVKMYYPALQIPTKINTYELKGVFVQNECMQGISYRAKSDK